jgi:hypothetical protein
MVSLMSLWLPILLSAVFVFIVSSIIHMVLRYHSSDFKTLPKEDEVMEALRRFDIPPGDYAMPYAASMEAMKSPAYLEKWKAGPVAFMTFVPSGLPSIAPSLVLWFITRSSSASSQATLPAPRCHMEPYRAVFRFVGCVAFTGYSLALLQHSIWYKRNWGTTLKSVFDGLVYALVTAGTFGWLWPH